MAYNLNDVINIALGEVGYLEKKSNSNLYDKTANAGSGNYTKYAEDMDKIVGFYNGKKQGFDWCDVFVDWCFCKAYGVQGAKKLLCQPDRSLGAGCPYSLGYFKSTGRFFVTPCIGDQIFFKDQAGDICHTGIVYNVDEDRVYTVEGNTSGGVYKRSYPIKSGSIAGYGRPDYGTPTILKTGSKGDEVKTLQTRLNEKQKELNLKFSPLAVDGIYGEKTLSAVREFQKAVGLTVDGIAGEKTLSALNTTVYPTLKSGSKGEYVKLLQTALNKALTGENLAVDGIFGNLTLCAVKAFQKKYSLETDGIVGSKTWTKLLEVTK